MILLIFVLVHHDRIQFLKDNGGWTAKTLAQHSKQSPVPNAEVFEVRISYMVWVQQ